jgi:cysteine desulfurase/selenocysteine lyase
MCGPTGVGVLFGKYKLLEAMDPVEQGGDMNDYVEMFSVTFKEAPFKFETGTPPIAEVIGLKEAIHYLEELGMDNIQEYVRQLALYALGKLPKIEGVTVYNPKADTGIIAFNIDGVHPHDAATNFDEQQIALRAGHHCAQLVSRWIGCSGTLRATIFIYNTKEDIDKFIDAVINTRDFFKKF